MGFSNKNNESQIFLGNIATTFKQMDNSFTGKRKLGLPNDTRDEFYQTFTGLVEVNKVLLLVNFPYVLRGNIQISRVERVGTYNDSNTSNYCISVQQVDHGLTLQQL